MKRTNYFNIAIITFIAILIGAIAYYSYTQMHGGSMKTYTNPAYGISFDYPSHYNLEENSLSSVQGATVVVLTDKKSIIPSNGEGPVSITVGMYPLSAFSFPAGANQLLSWITSSPYSNFAQSSQTQPSLTTVGTKNAYLYTWDGLYQGTTVATTHEANIVVFSVTYDGNNDMQIRKDFTDLVANVQFTGATSTLPVN
ncbi:MAG: hypothetical protein ACAH17_02635 [Candidatus Paceibacterota bacterium]